MSPAGNPALRRSRASNLRHAAVVGFVVVAREVQQTVQGEHPQLDRERVTGRPRLPRATPVAITMSPRAQSASSAGNDSTSVTASLPR